MLRWTRESAPVVTIPSFGVVFALLIACDPPAPAPPFVPHADTADVGATDAKSDVAPDTLADTLDAARAEIDVGD